MTIIYGGQYGDPYVNNSGGALVASDVVVIDPTADLTVTTTAAEGDLGVVGVVIRGGADGAYVRVATTGVVEVKVDAATAREDYLRTSTTATRATPEAAFEAGCFARALSTSAGVGTVWAVLDFEPPTINLADHHDRHEEGGADAFDTAGLDPAMTDDYSANVAEMQVQTDPGDQGAESLATDLRGELARLRYVLDQVIGRTFWYDDPAGSLEVIAAAEWGTDVIQDGWLWNSAGVYG